MRNEFKTHVEMTRRDLCDLCLACLAAQELAGDGGKKWEALREKLHKQLDELDAQLDEIEKFAMSLN